MMNELKVAYNDQCKELKMLEDSLKFTRNPIRAGKIMADIERATLCLFWITEKMRALEVK